MNMYPSDLETSSERAKAEAALAVFGLGVCLGGTLLPLLQQELFFLVELV